MLVLTKSDFDKEGWCRRKLIDAKNGPLEIRLPNYEHRYHIRTLVNVARLSVLGNSALELHSGLTARVIDTQAPLYITGECRAEQFWADRFVDIRGLLSINGEIFLRNGALHVSQYIRASNLFVAAGLMCSGGDIQVDKDISVGKALACGQGIHCGGKLSAGTWIAAGLGVYSTPRPQDTVIECGELLNGQIRHGTLVETNPSTAALRTRQARRLDFRSKHGVQKTGDDL